MRTAAASFVLFAASVLIYAVDYAARRAQAGGPEGWLLIVAAALGLAGIVIAFASAKLSLRQRAAGLAMSLPAPAALLTVFYFLSRALGN